MMHKNKSVDVHNFAMIPRADIPRSSFKIETAHKTTFDAGQLVPVYVDEVLPGDTFKLKMTAFARMATPIFPIMDNLHLDSFFFFVPNRLVWDNWQKFMGERTPDPDSSISFTIPQVGHNKTEGYDVGSIYDYYGLPTVLDVPGPITGGNLQVNALPFRAYNLIFNEWFRDQNLIDSAVVVTNDGPDSVNIYALRRRGKRHDYFTSALPFIQKGTAVSVPLGSTAPVIPTGTAPTFNSAGPVNQGNLTINLAGDVFVNGPGADSVLNWREPQLVADLSTATAATINQLRESFQIQRLLERDARGGTRYTEILRSHFGVISPDARLQRPEYLGGGSSQIQVTPIAQQSGTGASGTTTALGTLGAAATSLANRHGFSQSFTEHGYIIGLVCVRADLSYQQGIRKMWSRRTRYDYYFPVFAHLGEEPIFNRELYAKGTSDDALVFGYQERWASYRYNPSLITSLFRSSATGTLDSWHLAQSFTALPTLNEQFIEERPPMSRILAAGELANGQQFIFDSFFEINIARAMPLYSVPGLVDHF